MHQVWDGLPRGMGLKAARALVNSPSWRKARAGTAWLSHSLGVSSCTAHSASPWASAAAAPTCGGPASWAPSRLTRSSKGRRDERRARRRRACHHAWRAVRPRVHDRPPRAGRPHAEQRTARVMQGDFSSGSDWLRCWAAAALRAAWHTQPSAVGCRNSEESGEGRRACVAQLPVWR